MRRLRPRRLWPALMAGLLVTTAGPAVASQSLAGIRSAVESHVRDTVSGPGRVTGVEVDRLDPRLRLPACDKALETWQPEGYASPGRRTIGVRCTSPKAWKVYVPVRIEREVDAVVARRPLPRGHRVAAGDIATRAVRLAGLPTDYYTRPADVVGQETRRTVRSGGIIDSGDVVAPRLVRRGQALLIEAASGTVTVKMGGEALEDGRSGDLIRVRNTNSRRVVEARVVGRDRVRVAF